MSGTVAGKTSRKSSTGRKVDWGMVAVGILLIIASVILMTWPGITLVMIAAIAGIALVVTGIMDIASYVRLRSTPFTSGWTLATGILDIIIGIVFFMQPVVTAVVLPWIAAFLIVFYGIMSVVMGISFRSVGNGWGWVLAGGIASILLGVLFFFQPQSFIVFLALFVLIRGLMTLIYGFVAPKDIDYL